MFLLSTSIHFTFTFQTVIDELKKYGFKFSYGGDNMIIIRIYY